MKRYTTFITCLILLLIAFTSCNQNSYSAKRAEEDRLIEDFIKRQNIRIVYELPEDSLWQPNDYYKVPGYDDLYFHLIRTGDTTYSVKTGDKVLARYMRYTLDAVADTASYMTTSEQAYPTEFKYQINDATVPEGWHVAVKYMKHSGAACKIICPSKQGFETDKSSVTPYGYDLHIQLPRF